MSDILSTSDDGIVTITFNRTSKKNSITSGMYAAMAEALDRAATNSSIFVAIIQGQPEVFSAGNDLADFLGNPPKNVDAPVWQFLRAISQFPKPLIGSVSGVAVGIGTTMLLHCDLVYASASAKFSLPFVNLGLCPEAASSLLLPQLLGHQRAAHLLLFGDAFSAHEALSMGLINEIVASGDVNAHAMKKAKLLLEKPLASLMETKRLLKMNSSAEVKKQIEVEGKAFFQLMSGPDVKEAVAAFSEKRKPVFRKR